MDKSDPESEHSQPVELKSGRGSVTHKVIRQPSTSGSTGAAGTASSGGPRVDDSGVDSQRTDADFLTSSRSEVPDLNSPQDDVPLLPRSESELNSTATVTNVERRSDEDEEQPRTPGSPSEKSRQKQPTTTTTFNMEFPPKQSGDVQTTSSYVHYKHISSKSPTSSSSHRHRQHQGTSGSTVIPVLHHVHVTQPEEEFERRYQQQQHYVRSHRSQSRIAPVQSPGFYESSTIPVSRRSPRSRAGWSRSETTRPGTYPDLYYDSSKTRHGVHDRQGSVRESEYQQLCRDYNILLEEYNNAFYLLEQANAERRDLAQRLNQVLTRNTELENILRHRRHFSRSPKPHTRPRSSSTRYSTTYDEYSYTKRTKSSGVQGKDAFHFGEDDGVSFNKEDVKVCQAPEGPSDLDQQTGEGHEGEKAPTDLEEDGAIGDVLEEEEEDEEAMKRQSHQTNITIARQESQSRKEKRKAKRFATLPYSTRTPYPLDTGLYSHCGQRPFSALNINTASRRSQQQSHHHSPTAARRTPRKHRAVFRSRLDSSPEHPPPGDPNLTAAIDRLTQLLIENRASSYAGHSYVADQVSSSSAGRRPTIEEAVEVIDRRDTNTLPSSPTVRRIYLKRVDSRDRHHYAY